MEMPALPDNQRWSVHSEFGTFVIVRLQRRRWGIWWTIARSTGALCGGASEVSSCVEHILNRDYYARIHAEAVVERKRRISEIPFGASRE